MIKNDKFDNSSFDYFAIKKSMVSWQQQSATAWTELYKEFATNSHKMSESWSNALWNTWTSKEGLQSGEIKDNTKKDNTMRALVLQGGGAIGAFQAGAFKALYEKITTEDKENGNEGRPLFDIIAGTSIGAINAAVIVSHVIENKTWRGSSEKLTEFWEYLSCPTPDIMKVSANWKKEYDKNTSNAASAEAARRYYSVKEFFKSGVEKVYSPLPPRVDEKFFDYEEIDGRKFWDGGILSNTPIRELIQAHRDFWEHKIGSKGLENSILEEASFNVPDLELYIVNLWHSNDNVAPSDPDGMTERHRDIKSHDQYYVKESILLTHYIHLIENLIQLGVSKNDKYDNNYELKKAINRILQEYTASIDSTETPKKYLDIIKAQFEITKIESIERRDDHDTISAKDGDFTSETINKLIRDGYESTWRKYSPLVLQHPQ